MLYLTSNRRAVRFLQKQLNQQYGIFAFEDWLQYGLQKTSLIESFTFLTPQQSFALWFDLVKEAETALPPVKLAKELMKAYAICQRFLVPIEPLHFSISADASFFLEKVEQFEKICKEKKWVDKHHIPDLWLSQIDKINLPKKMSLYGFDEFTPLLQNMISHFKQAGVVVAVEQYAVQSTLRGFKAQDRCEEIAYAFTEAKLANQMNSSTKLGVVITDLSNHLDWVQALALKQWGAGEAEPVYNISLSKTLIEIPLIQESLFYITPIAYEFDRDYVLSFLHAYSARQAESKPLYALARVIAEQAERYVTTKHLKALAQANHADLFVELLNNIEATLVSMKSQKNASAWLILWREVWEKTGWLSAIAQAHPAVLKKWNETLLQFETLDKVLNKLPLQEAQHLLRQLLNEARLDESVHHAAIQIMGELESAGLGFDCVWVTGLTENKWPREQSPNKFIPLAIQKKHQLPHSSSERELDFAKTRLHHLMQSGAEVVLSYHQKDETGSLMPSALIPESVQFELKTIFRVAHGALANVKRQADYVPSKSGRVKGVMKLLENMALCPFRAFAKKELRLQSLEWFQMGISPKQRGQLIHKALEKLWRGFKSQDGLLHLSEEEIEMECFRAVDQAAKSELAFVKLDEMTQTIELNLLEKLLLAWLNQEKQRAPFKIQALEEKLYGRLGSYDFELRLDRIDITQEGPIVIDYKTSANFLYQPAFKALPYLQLNLYAHVKGQLADAAYVVIERQTISQDKAWLGFYDAKNPYHENSEATIQSYIHLLDRYYAGSQAVEPIQASVCRDCDVRAVCRVREG